jgi:bacteriocin biosynthesis cyclodehydratase domain-containing protein
MPPLTPTTLTRLSPAVPLLWRDERTLQLGLDGDVRIDAEAEWVELLLSRMRAGFRRASFDVVAHAVGAPRAAARALFGRLEHLLVDDSPAPRAAWVERLGLTDARTEHRLRESLADEGVPTGERARRSDAAVVLVAGSAAAVQLAAHLRDDVPHLPVAVGRDQVTIGPLVVPGRTPCLTCRDLHARDLDPAWPRLHTQLVARDPGRVRAVLVANAGAIAAHLLAATLSAESEVVRLRGDGSRDSRAVRFHEGCLCRAPSSRSRPGTATEPVHLVPPNATTTVTGFARLA